MPSRQFEHLQASTLDRLRRSIPASCPLLVGRAAGGGFEVWTLDGIGPHVAGRYQVVAAWIAGYRTAWEEHRHL